MAKKKTSRKAKKQAPPAEGIRGDRLRKIREDRGMTQMDLAAVVDSTPPVISQIELGKRNPVAPFVRRLCIALDVSADYLLGLSDSPKRVT